VAATVHSFSIPYAPDNAAHRNIAVANCHASRLIAITILALLTITRPALAQRFSFGATAGAPLTQYFQTSSSFYYETNTSYASATRRYTLGGAAEWHLTRSLGIELDAMYHRIGYADTVSGNSPTDGLYYYSHTEVEGNSWDFPLMAKYRLFSGTVRPYVAAGGVLRHLGPMHATDQISHSLRPGGPLSNTTLTTVDSGSPPELTTRTYPGLTAAIGVDFGSGHIHWEPELRWTHWTSNFGGPYPLLSFPPNQVEFLLGVRFR
jgi:hypothetical protein